MSKLHALLVAINNYHPASRVSGLDGCINDLTAMKEFIEKYYGNLSPNIKTLIDKQATREGVITAFDEHLIQGAQPGDTVLFYYAGHGSFAATATEFQKFDPQAKDESMVCYDSRIPGHYDLSDKELAVLFSRIDESAHIVAIIDACHSSSMTRSVAEAFQLGKKRFTPRREEDKTRQLNTYLMEGDHYYDELWKREGKVSIPRSKHLLLSACDRDQLANETTDRRGLFTTTLLHVLEQNRDISYSDLFCKIRHAVQRKAKQQLPTIASLEGFNPNTTFLLQHEKQNNKKHRIEYVKGSWRMSYGAIHGLPSDVSEIENLQIGIYSDTGSANENVLLETVKVEKVLLKESILSFKRAEPNLIFRGEIQNFPGAMLVGLSGEDSEVEAFEKVYELSPSPFLLLDKNAPDAKYKLAIEKDQLLIKLNSNDSLIHGIEGNEKNGIEYISAILEQIESWERLNKLQNAKTKIQKAIDLKFIDESISDNIYETDAPVITLDFPKRGEDKDEDGDLISLFYTIEARNVSAKKLYVALLHLNANFGISTFFPCGELPPNGEWIVLDNEHGIHIEKEDWNEVTDVFKLIVSTEPFDDFKFQQEDFNRGEIAKRSKSIGTRGISSRKKAESDWCTHTITVNTIRKEKSISNKEITFEKEKIKIKAHPEFKADVAFAPVKSGTRSVHAVSILSDVFDSEEFELLDLAEANTRSAQDKTIIEFSGIKNENQLSDKPLEIQLNQQLTTDEYLVPVTFDGEFILPFGNVKKEEDGSSTITIDHLPTSEDVNRKRSATRALWFCLLKVTGFREKAFRLRLAQLNPKGKLVRNRAGINTKVAEAKKILILIHGIIGDTNCMAANLSYMVDPEEERKYDVMLTFDYENLNEPIEKIAEEFNKCLMEFDLKVGEKQIDIIAHSMGGLVSRYLIENIREGDGLINRLIMLGTPNGGSPFGSIPEYITIFRTLTTAAINFGKPFLAPLLTQLTVLEKLNGILKDGRVVLVTLNQMNADSEFIKALYKNEKPKTEYIVIAGDITKYTPTTDAKLVRFSEKVLLNIGDKMNREMPNDIAVSVDQILDVPPKFNAEKTYDSWTPSELFSSGCGGYAVVDKAATLVKRLLIKSVLK